MNGPPARANAPSRPASGKPPTRVAVLASGRGSNLEALLQAIGKGWVDAEVTLVASDRGDAGALQRARDHGVAATLSLPREPGEERDAYDARLLDAVQAEAPDLVVLAGFMRILGADFVQAYRHRMVNIHPALLPSFKGPRGVRDTLAAGAKLAGCTTHYVTEDLDGGPILLQAALPVHPGDDEVSLARRVLRLEHQLLPRTVQLWHEGRIHVEAGLATIQPGPTWDRLHRPEALYSEGF